MIDEVSACMRISWEEAYKLGCAEFFNIWGYIIEKNRRRAKANEEWARKH